MLITCLAQLWCIHHCRSRCPQECVHIVINSCMCIQIRCGLLPLCSEIVRRHCFSLVSSIKVGSLEMSTVQAYITMRGEGCRGCHAIAVFNIMWGWKHWTAYKDSSYNIDTGIVVRFITPDNDWKLKVVDIESAKTFQSWHGRLHCYSVHCCPKRHSLSYIAWLLQFHK